MNVERDRKRLAEYRAELREAEASAARIPGLREIVAGLEKVVGDAEAEHAETPRRERPVPGTRRTPAGGGGLKSILAAQLEKRGRMDVDDAIAFVAALPEYLGKEPPSRNTIVSRLGDLVREGEAHSLARGLYEHKSFALQLNGSAPSSDREAVERRTE